MIKKIAFMVLVFCVAACTQDTQAPVEYKGKNFYGKNAAPKGYDTGEQDTTTTEYSDAPKQVFKSGYQRPQKSAPVAAISESDIPSPGAAPFAKPSKPLEKVTETMQPDTRKGIDLITPVNGGKIIAHFADTNNDGINIAANEGEPIVAAASGMVVYSDNNVKDYGNMVVLRHDNNWLTAYSHASKIVVKKNDYVKQGDIIAYVGATGGVKSPQLHFSLREGKTSVDPEHYLPAK